jgi:hypothetical protein
MEIVAATEIPVAANHTTDLGPWIYPRRNHGQKRRIRVVTPITPLARPGTPRPPREETKRWRPIKTQVKAIGPLTVSVPDSPISAPIVAVPSHTVSADKRAAIVEKKRSRNSKRSIDAKLNSQLKELQSYRPALASLVSELKPADQAAVAKRHAPKSIEEARDADLLMNASRGPQYVILQDSPGTTHIDNHASRRLTVAYRDYLVPCTTFYGFRRSIGDVHPEGLGISFEDGLKTVSLPVGLVAEVGAFWVGKACTHDNYAVSQSYLRNLVRRIDFSTPELEEDALLYGSFVGFNLRAAEREGMRRVVHGRSYGNRLFRLAKVAATAVAAACVPVVTASTSAVPNASVALSVTFALGVMATISTAGYIAWRVGALAEVPKPVALPFSKLSSVVSQCIDKVVRSEADLKVHVHANPERVNTAAARVVGVAVDGCAPVVIASNQVNMVKALKKRALAVPPPFDPAVRQDCIDWIIKYWPTLVAKPFHLSVPTDLDEYRSYVLKWIDGCNSKPKVKELYRATLCELLNQGITCHSDISPDLIWSWTKRESFVKTETVLKNEDASPRQILSATPQFIVLTAPFVSQVTGVIKSAWSGHKSLVYAPGRSNRELAVLATQREYDNHFNRDFNGYDSAQNEQHLRGEVRIYDLYGQPRGTKQLFLANTSIHGSSRLGVQFQFPYIRASGDPQTTQMNTVWNAGTDAYVYCSERALHPRDMTPDVYQVLAGGDDGVTQYDGPLIDWASRYAALGMPITGTHVTCLSRIEFLSCRLTRTSIGWVFVPKVGRALAKLAYSVRAMDKSQCPAIALGGALSFLHSSSGCPPLLAYIRAIIKKCGSVIPIRPQDEPWKMLSCWTGDPTPDTWADLWDTYSWTKELQQILEADLEFATLGQIIQSPAIQMLIDLDTSKDTPMFTRAWDEAEDDLLREAKSAHSWVRDLASEDGEAKNPGPGSESDFAAATREARNERILSTFAAKAGITDEAKDFVTICIDPFHDTQLNMPGYPDGSRDPIATQMVKASYSISVPTGITTGTWDVMIVNLPWVKNLKLATNALMGGTNTNPNNVVYYQSFSNTITAGGLLFIAVPTGTVFNPTISSPSSSVTYTSNPLNDTFTLGDHRVIANAFEVHNTTATLYRQGMCTTFSIPVPSIDTSGSCQEYSNNFGTFILKSYGVSVVQVPMWPQTLNAAVLTPGARQWTAEQGAYVVSRLQTDDVDVSCNGWAVQPFVNGGDSSSAGLNLGPIPTLDNYNATANVFGNVFWTNFEMSGALFTGLSLQSTLTVNQNLLVERHPDPSIVDLIVLARPPPCRDESALALYKHLATKLPTGVPVAMNGLGEWFADALSTAADFIAPVMSVLPGPLGAIGAGISGVNAAYKSGKGIGTQVKEGLSQAYQTNPYVDPLAGMSQPQRMLNVLSQSRQPNRRRTQRLAVRSANRELARDEAVVASTAPNQRVAQRQVAAMERIRSQGQRRRAGV